MEINAKSIIGVMTLSAAQGATLRFRFDGEDEIAMAVAIVGLIERGFDEL
jgi:phosphotransferase system HPr (HPr) family protein